MTYWPTKPLSSLARQIHEWARGQGFYDEGQVRPFDGQIALVHSEASEALEHWRNGHEIAETFWTGGRDGDDRLAFDTAARMIELGWKPDGVPIELADILIRVLDTMAAYGLDPDELVETKMAYNRTRPPRNGGKRS